MGLHRVVFPGSGYLKLSDVTSSIMSVPYTDGLVGSYFLSALNGDGFINNYANAEKPLVQVGRPTMYPGFARLNKNNYFDTGLTTSTTSNFIYVLCRQVAPIDSDSKLLGMALANYTEVAADGYGSAIIPINANSRIGGRIIATKNGAQSFTNPGFAVSALNSTDKMQLLRMDINNSAFVGNIYNRETGASAGAGGAGGAISANTRTLRIGSHCMTNGDFAGDVDVSAVLIYSGVQHDNTKITAIQNYLLNILIPQAVDI